jgi:hypothetical protein
MICYASIASQFLTFAIANILFDNHPFQVPLIGLYKKGDRLLIDTVTNAITTTYRILT